MLPIPKSQMITPSAEPAPSSTPASTPNRPPQLLAMPLPMAKGTAAGARDSAAADHPTLSVHSSRGGGGDGPPLSISKQLQNIPNLQTSPSSVPNLQIWHSPPPRPPHHVSAFPERGAGFVGADGAVGAEASVRRSGLTDVSSTYVGEADRDTTRACRTDTLGHSLGLDSAADRVSLQHTATHCNTLQHTSTSSDVPDALQETNARNQWMGQSGPTTDFAV